MIFDAVLRKKTQKSSFDQSDNIVIRNNYHKKHKQNKAYGVDVALVFGIYGLAANRLYQEKEKSAAVERGQGKKIIISRLPRFFDDAAEAVTSAMTFTVPTGPASSDIP